MPVHSPLASVSATQKVLSSFGLDTKKALGQHFLISDGVVGRICELAEVDHDDFVLEIGPGIGTLSYALLEATRGVIAIERDGDLLPILAATCAPFSDIFTVVNKDALKLTESDLTKALTTLCGLSDSLPVSSQDGLSVRTLPNKLVSNLPYAVAATLVLDCFQKFRSLQSATVMVQSEVADRMCAQLGTKDYGAYTVKLSFFARPVKRFTVGPQNFFPPPRVDSAVVRLDRHTPRLSQTFQTLHTSGTPYTLQESASPKTIEAACLMADAAFATRRKTLLNSCKTYFASSEGEKKLKEIAQSEEQAKQSESAAFENVSPESVSRETLSAKRSAKRLAGLVEKLPQIIESAGIDARVRGETLGSEDFLRLGDTFLHCLSRRLSQGY